MFKGILWPNEMRVKFLAWEECYENSEEGVLISAGDVKESLANA